MEAGSLYHITFLTWPFLRVCFTFVRRFVTVLFFALVRGYDCLFSSYPARLHCLGDIAFGPGGCVDRPQLPNERR